MRLGEALARCPGLRLVPPDPGAAAQSWEATLRGLEGIGAAVESERPGEAFFAIDGLLGLHGGVEGVLSAARGAAASPVRIGRGRNRFAAYLEARGAREPIPAAALVERLGAPEREAADFVTTLERLGIGTLDALARLRDDQVADRFGRLGLRALALARGEDTPLRPRSPHEELIEEIELPEGTAGAQLDRALELLVDRLLAAPQRRGRALLGTRLGALLCGGGSWSVEQGLARPTASPQVLGSLLRPRLAALPGPAAALRLQALALGPRVGRQLELEAPGAKRSRGRLAKALREIRAAEGAEALLRVLPVDSASRVPERWAMLTPYPDP